MNKLRIPVFFLATIILTTGSYISVDAQSIKSPTPTVTSKSARIGLSIDVPSEPVHLGQKVWVSLTVKNRGNKEIIYPAEVRVYVEGVKGEPRTTLRQRQLTGRLNPGERGISTGGFEPSIAAGASFTRKYDLSKFYKFEEPGKYTVYIEVLDEAALETKTGAGLWVRSPVAQFELQPTQ